MKRSLKQREAERVRRAVGYVKRRLKLDLEFVVSPAPAGEHAGLLDIERSYRGTEDRKVWLITFDAEVVARETTAALRRHAFHEVLHALTWPLFDEIEAAIRRIPDAAVRRELTERSLDARENVVYELERKIGPLAFPHLPWTDP
ncbi:MAG TPA: hypothetical protein PLB02_11975 [Thermoanaerobaculia bacterium]|nr:hypothetical protein [Thermoanaerobaculia bacterium]HQR68103.1 hypothetical protein [Thermoanaerobaculia bacterium]